MSDFLDRSAVRFIAEDAEHAEKAADTAAALLRLRERPPRHTSNKSFLVVSAAVVRVVRVVRVIRDGQLAPRALAFLLALGLPATAQVVQPEARLDALGPAPFTVEPGVGANVFLGNYVRVGVAVGYDVRRQPGDASDAWRGDLMARVTLDPFRQQRWGFSMGGGLTYRRDAVRLAVIADLEGPQVGPLLPALQVGLSGGFRAGLAFRRAVRRRR